MFDPESTPGLAREQFLSSEQESIAVPRAEFAPATAPENALGTELTRDPSWLLIEDGFTLAREHEVESLFAIGNGYVGNRGSLAEGTPLSAPATFAAGIFELDPRPGSVPALLVLPDWTGINAWVEGTPLNMEQGEVLHHRRILDLRHAMLWREWRHRDLNGRITRVVGVRLASLADRHVLAQCVTFSPENYSGELQLETSVVLPPLVLTSMLADEYKGSKNVAHSNVLPIALQSPGRPTKIVFSSASQLVAHGHEVGTKQVEMADRSIRERFRVQVQIGAEYRLDRLVSVYTSRDLKDEADAAVEHVARVFPAGVRKTIVAHANAWEERWNSADLRIEGDEVLQRALRFAEYHLISAANPQDEYVSIGARALTGEAYKGHVFWDTEIFMLPFYGFSHPPSARALLMYRYHMLPAAREKAHIFGCRGAMYPWESADTGEETTPRFVIDPKGHVITVLNGEMEVHITADVAYAVWQYWNVTADDEFFLHAGAEIMLETARLWASRGRMENDGRYHIRHVIGPDEYHENVDDNAYTNTMASWNMKRGIETARLLAQRWPQRWRELSSRLDIQPEELTSWSQFADAIFTGFDPHTKLFEQFQGYFQKEPVELAAYEPRHAAMDVILGHEEIQHTNVIKQADVVMGTYLLRDEYTSDLIEANFRYYEPRTGHGSSLSPSMHALVAARLGNLSLAEKYLRQAAEIDLGNNMGNAAGGVHAAAIGGLWQAMIFGFAGLDFKGDSLTFNPHLLLRWRRFEFPLQYRGRKLHVSIEPGGVQVAIQHGSDPLNIAVARGPEIMAHPGRQYLAEWAQREWQAWQQLPS